MGFWLSNVGMVKTKVHGLKVIGMQRVNHSLIISARANIAEPFSHGSSSPTL